VRSGTAPTRRSVEPVSNLEAAPAEVACGAAGVLGTEVLRPREVPLGGPRAIPVQRTLPQRQRSLIGAWCFIDHYGPVRARMDVPPHPHTGLQTVSWLFSGAVEHRDSAGVHAVVRPGELNLMTAGAGICHSEVSIESDAVLHGVQLWVALPDSARDTGRDFAHYAPTALTLPGAVARVFLGELVGGRSPVHTFTPLVGAQIDLEPDAALDIGVDPAFEHGVLCDVGPVAMGETTLSVADLGYQGAGTSSLRLRNMTDRAARVLLLGGTPFTEELVMWWNFLGRSHDDIVGYRRLWQEADDRFGAVTGYRGSVTRLPAPPLPTTRLRPRSTPKGPNAKECP
jgi:quercetin 2,3-dioxygenase